MIPPDSPSAPPPKILANRERSSRFMEVEYSLPGLRTARVAVPRNRWVAQGHALIGHKLAELLADLDRQAATRSDSLPGQG